MIVENKTVEKMSVEKKSVEAEEIASVTEIVNGIEIVTIEIEIEIVRKSVIVTVTEKERTVPVLAQTRRTASESTQKTKRVSRGIQSSDEQ